MPSSGFAESWHQQDSWSCGYHAARILDIQRRKLRGERPGPVLTPEAYIAHHKALITKLRSLQAEHKGMQWPPEPEEPEAPAAPAAPEEPEAPAAPEGPEVPKVPEPPKPAKGLEEALARAKTSKCCKPRKADGQKGCSKCMGEFFGAIRLRQCYGKPGLGTSGSSGQV